MAPFGSHRGRPGPMVAGVHKQAKLLAEDFVVALAGLFQPNVILVQFRLAVIEDAIDALQLGALLVAAPVGACDAVQFEDADVAGAGDMRPPAEVGERALGVKRDRLAFGQVVDKLNFVRLAVFALVGQRLVTRLLRAGQGQVFPSGCAASWLSISARSSGVSVPGQVEVVVEALFNGRGRWQAGHPGKISKTACAMTCAAVWRFFQISLTSAVAWSAGSGTGSFLQTTECPLL